jgi:hypothetical protein
MSSRHCLCDSKVTYPSGLINAWIEEYCRGRVGLAKRAPPAVARDGRFGVRRTFFGVASSLDNDSTA